MFIARDHHLKIPVCLTRPPYRDGRKARAVKVYTIAQESKYLLVQNIPAIAGVMEQLLPYFSQYGTIEQCCKLDGYEREDAETRFCETALIKFGQIHQARLAKWKLDDWNFMGEVLHICYAPECETIDDLREKFVERRTNVQRRNHLNRIVKTRPTSSSMPTTNEIRAKMRDLVQNSQLISLALQQEMKRKKRIQL